MIKIAQRFSVYHAQESSAKPASRQKKGDIGAKDQSAGGDEGWAQPQNMVIFSFGREDTHALNGTDAVAVFGFLDKKMDHEQITNFIKDRLENPFEPVKL